MTFELRVLTDKEILGRAPAPSWYTEMIEREEAFNRKHPRCIGCGRFVRKNVNICSECEDYGY